MCRHRSEAFGVRRPPPESHAGPVVTNLLHGGLLFARPCNAISLPSVGMKVTQLTAMVGRLGQKPPVAPYQNRYNSHSAKEALLVRLETDTGVVGWGETPVDWINKSYEGAPEDLLRKQVLGRDPFEIEAW